MNRWRARLYCRLFGHQRVIFGTMRDICSYCLTIVEEHPHGRGRASEGPRHD